MLTFTEQHTGHNVLFCLYCFSRPVLYLDSIIIFN
jgi:hypothetical protein